jgi:hypothetical protein
MTNIPPGYVTRVRAEHLNRIFLDGIREIGNRFAIRAAERCAPESDTHKVRAMLDEEAQRAVRELELLHAEVREQLWAPEH